MVDWHSITAFVGLRGRTPWAGVVRPAPCEWPLREHADLHEQGQAQRREAGLQRGIAAQWEQRTQRGERRRELSAAAAAAHTIASDGNLFRFLY